MSAKNENFQLYNIKKSDKWKVPLWEKGKKMKLFSNALVISGDQFKILKE